MPTLNVPAAPQTPAPQTPASQTSASQTSAARTLAADAAANCPPPAQPPGLADPEAPHDGDHNQGGARPAGLEYQRELGTEQDA